MAFDRVPDILQTVEGDGGEVVTGHRRVSLGGVDVGNAELQRAAKSVHVIGEVLKRLVTLSVRPVVLDNVLKKVVGGTICHVIRGYEINTEKKPSAP